jgi:predicted kinase
LEAVIFIGIPASGKTTFYRERFFATHIRLNLDMLRTRRRLTILLQACLEAKQSFVLDNTNLSAVERAVTIQRAKDAKFQVMGYFFTPDSRRAQRWNAERQGKARVPDVAIWSGMKSLETPSFEEGFDALYTVHIDAQRQFNVMDLTT